MLGSGSTSARRARPARGVFQAICRYIDTTAASAHYDLVVIGSGPAAQQCALETAKRGKQVAIVDKKGLVGGVCVHTGTIPSKTFREAVLHLTGYRHQGFYGRAYQPWRERISFPDILRRVKQVEEAETAVITKQLRREAVETITGTARFLEHDGGPDSPIKLMILRTASGVPGGPATPETSPYRHLEANKPKMIISAEKVLVASGTRPVRPSHIDFDGEMVFDSDQLLWGGVEDVPRSMIVVGAGVIGMEYASMINCIPGCTVTVIDNRPEILGFADKEAVDSLCYIMRQRGARFLLKEKLGRVEKSSDGARVFAHLESGKRVVGDALLYTMGRQGNTDMLNLEAVGLGGDNRGLLHVNDYYQTPNARIYACGDVIGFPALASTSLEQGRRAAVHMWKGDLRLDDDAELDHAGQEHKEQHHAQVKSVMQDTFLGRSSEQFFPYGIYTIPEVAMIGKTEAQLTNEGIPYEVGVAKYVELAKGQMLGGVDGFLKLVFHADTLKLLGVHCIGEGATEIIHIGQVVMSQGGTLEYFRTAVFNYPTLAEAYTVAAHDGFHRISR